MQLRARNSNICHEPERRKDRGGSILSVHTTVRSENEARKLSICGPDEQGARASSSSLLRTLRGYPRLRGLPELRGRRGLVRHLVAMTDAYVAILEMAQQRVAASKDLPASSDHPHSAYIHARGVRRDAIVEGLGERNADAPPAYGVARRRPTVGLEMPVPICWESRARRVAPGTLLAPPECRLLCPPFFYRHLRIARFVGRSRRSRARRVRCER